MARKNQQAVELSNATLRGIRQLIFAKNGLNLDNIINDLAFQYDANADQIAINLAIVFAGLKPDIALDVYDVLNKGVILRYHLTGYSLINQQVQYTTVRIKFNADTNEWVEEENPSTCHEMYALNIWERLYLSLEEAVEACEIRYK